MINFYTAAVYKFFNLKIGVPSNIKSHIAAQSALLQVPPPGLLLLTRPNYKILLIFLFTALHRTSKLPDKVFLLYLLLEMAENQTENTILFHADILPGLQHIEKLVSL